MNATCNHCNGDILYSPNQAGDRVGCPHCGKETRLPKPPANWRKRIRNTLFVLGPLIVVGAVMLLVLVILPWSERFNFNGLQQGFAVLATLLIGTGLIILAIAWLLFPVVQWWYSSEILKELRKRR